MSRRGHVTTRRVIFINRYAYPDKSATSQLLMDLCFHVAASGARVDVLTSRQHYEDPGAALARLETVSGVCVQRLWTTRNGRSGMFGRAIDYLTFYVSAMVGVLRLARSGDIVVVMTDPPILSVFIAPVALLRGAKMVNWLQDVFPEVAQNLGVSGFDGLLGRLVRTLRNWSLVRSDVNVVIGSRMRAVLEAQGLPPQKLVEIHNWALMEDVPARAANVSALRVKWNLVDCFVVGYSGNLGRAHEFVTILDAAQRLRSDASLRFLVIGGGARIQQMKNEVASRGLRSSFVFQPYQARSDLSRSLALPDVHWVSLRPELEGLIVPSKFYGILAKARPVIIVGDPEGELGSLAKRSACGYAIAIGDDIGLAAAIAALKEDESTRMEMGRRALELFTEKFSSVRAFAAWDSVLRRVGDGT